ncbi:MAG: ornithine carbamoyltransferase [Actinobacteria bacterium]|nr:ornithine carbamoyltransferase [Actinomycetota bacterium]
MQKVKKTKKDFLTLRDYSKEEIIYLLELAEDVKKNGYKYSKILKDKNLALLFDKPSTRTRISFEAGINQLGGNCLVLDSKTMQIGRGETYSDTAKIFNSYLDGVIIRTFKQETVETIADNCDIPVINALTDSYHPCQILSDMFTLYEEKLLFKENMKFAYIGDSNNVLNSLLIGFTKLGIDITAGCPEKYSPDKKLLEYLKSESEKSGNKITVINNPELAAKDADVIYTDVWVSMGDEENTQKIYDLKPYQINMSLISNAKTGAKIMHCLPAHRELEITSEVLDSKNSIVWMQAKNRLYAQKALLTFLYSN